MKQQSPDPPCSFSRARSARRISCTRPACSYAVAILYVAWFAINRPFGTYASLAAFAESRRQSLAPFFYLSRGLSAAMGTLTVWWVFAIARRVFDETIAIVAALFLALAYLHVRDSHFGTLDVSMTALVVLSVLMILRWQDKPGPWRAAAAGLVGGLATSTKYNALGVFVPWAVALAMRAADGRQDRRVALRHLAQAFAVFLAAFVLGFVGASPYVVVAWRQFVADLNAQSATLAHGHGLVLSRGWWYHATFTLPAALGWPMYLAGAAGAAGLLLTRWRQSAVVLAFPLAYFIVAGSGYRVFARDMLPVVPFLCISAGWLDGFCSSCARAEGRRGQSVGNRRGSAGDRRAIRAQCRAARSRADAR